MTSKLCIGSLSKGPLSDTVLRGVRSAAFNYYLGIGVKGNFMAFDVKGDRSQRDTIGVNKASISSAVAIAGSSSKRALYD